MSRFDKFAPYAKAIIAAIVACLTALATGAGDESISLYEGIVAAIAFFTALGAVWRVPNRPPFLPEAEQ